MTESQLTQYLMAAVIAELRKDGSAPCDILDEAKAFFDSDLPQTKKEREKVKKFDMRDALKSHGVEDKVINDFFAIRRLKKIANTEPAFQLLLREVRKAGISVSEAVSFSVSHNWAGFKAEWWKKEHPQEHKEEQSKWQ